MIRKRHLFARNAVAILAATPLLWIAPSVNAQSSSPSSQESRTSPNSDITRQELARFDQFLDSHQEIAEQLRRDPSLVNDHNYVQATPELQTFLQDHPGVREEIKENPNYFMRQENRYDRGEDNMRRQELARFDQFLDSHREVSEQLRRDPSLVKDQQFLQSHPALQSFLQDHPTVREDLQRNPNAFMRQENQCDRQEARQDSLRRAELAQFDRFLDSHRETAEQLRRDPSLVKSQQFVQNHPALQSFLQQHPDIQQRLDQNPNAFMRQENRFDNNERDADARNRDFDRDDARRNNDRDRDNGYRADNDASQDARNRDHGQVASFDQFLDKHQEIAEQLRRDPSLAKNQQFVNNHPALQAYLQDHQ